MSIEENKALVRRYLEALSGKPKPAEVVRVIAAHLWASPQRAKK